MEVHFISIVFCLDSLHFFSFNWFINTQEDHAVTIGRLLDKMALSKLGDVIALQFDENTSRSRASSRVSRVKSASSGTKRAEDGQSAEEVAALLAEALKHMELAGVFPGTVHFRCLFQPQLNLC